MSSGGSTWASERLRAVERANEASSAEQANEWAVRFYPFSSPGHPIPNPESQKHAFSRIRKKTHNGQTHVRTYNGQMVRPTDGWTGRRPTDNPSCWDARMHLKTFIGSKKQNFVIFEFVKSGIVCYLFMSNSGKNLISIFGFLVRCAFKWYATLHTSSIVK